MRKEVRFAGFGGQGIVLMGHIFGNAYSIQAGKNAALTQSYGPEARGGACSTDIVLSSTQIEYPLISKPDVLAVLSQEAFNIYAKKLKPTSTIIIDKDMVKFNIDDIPKGVDIYTISSTAIAESLGRKIVANIVMLGHVIRVSKLIDAGFVEKAIRHYAPKGTEELNINAFKQGFFAKKHKLSRNRKVY